MNAQGDDRQIRAGMSYTVEINVEECKGCGLCVEACPLDLLRLRADFNGRGYHPAEFLGFDAEVSCTGCGVCFYACPEPGAITIRGEEIGTATVGV